MSHQRLFGLDWLRIGAFGLLILYHIGMVFVPWEWHVKAAEPVAWLEWPMLAVNAWRLSLLFVVAGVASRFLLDRHGAGAFSRSRSLRLLLPLAFGMAILVAPQPWVELRTQHGYGEGFWRFWLHDYWRFGPLDGVMLPTWNHLWFVAYLWVYAMILAAVAALAPAGLGAAVRHGAERSLAGRRLLALPAVVLLAFRLTLEPVFGETHKLVDDWYLHAEYGLVFGFGAVLARSDALWASVVRLRRAALAMAVAGFAVVVVVRALWPEALPSGPAWVAGRAGQACQAWGAIVAFLGLARVRLDRDSAARRYLTEAVFPFYVAHQTVIVLAAYWLRPLGLGAAAEFALLAAATVAGCLLFHEAARRSGPLRPLFGLAPGRRPAVGAHPRSRKQEA